MAFDIFKKKEVIESSNTEKSDHDIVEDFGNYVQGEINPNNLTLSSFENNFQELTNNDDDLIPDRAEINTNNEKINLNNNIDISYDSFVENNNQAPISENDNIINESNINYDNQNIHNINNYDYNPIINNLENAQINIQNSQDVNEVLSNIHKQSNQEQLKYEEPTIVQNDINTKPVNHVPTIKEQYQYNDVDPGYKRCPKCGQRMREDYKQCFVCGMMI